MEAFITNDDLDGLRKYIKEKSNKDEKIEQIYLKKCKHIMTDNKIFVYLTKNVSRNFSCYTIDDAITINDIDFVLSELKDFDSDLDDPMVILTNASLECFKILINNHEKIDNEYFTSFLNINTIEKLTLIFENQELMDKLTEEDSEGETYKDFILYLALVQDRQYDLIPFLIQNGANPNSEDIFNDLINNKDKTGIKEWLKYNPLVTEEMRQKINKL